MNIAHSINGVPFLLSVNQKKDPGGQCTDRAKDTQHTKAQTDASKTFKDKEECQQDECEIPVETKSHKLHTSIID
jgi:hypothetical protein